MTKGVLADTGPLYALADPSDQHHVRAHKESARLRAEDYYVAVAYSTIAEAFTLVLRRTGSVYAQIWLRGLFDVIAPVNPEPRDYQAAVSLLAGYPDQSITLFDAVAAVLAERLKLPIWTYDHHFDVMRVIRWK